MNLPKQPEQITLPCLCWMVSGDFTRLLCFELLFFVLLYSCDFLFLYLFVFCIFVTGDVAQCSTIAGSGDTALRCDPACFVVASGSSPHMNAYHATNLDTLLPTSFSHILILKQKQLLHKTNPCICQLLMGNKGQQRVQLIGMQGRDLSCLALPTY